MINWKTIKTELQDKLKSVKSDKEMKNFVETIFGGVFYANQDEILKKLLNDKLKFNLNNEKHQEELQLKPHTSNRNYIG